jgi:hypothetical protein
VTNHYVIAFAFPEGRKYAGVVGDVWGFVGTADDANKFTDAMGARRVLENAYGAGTRPYGVLVAV